ncbi:hypothetical protein [Ramlibacter sp.]|uniref:hypothetical protein n=1 Tax=Ramlibacter sp. TaxID=1917967 RepID=UPI002618B65A|nr:hypothetical protein [Ramlibacter sp.]MDB5957290.1 hypothetical protein [Ramlibacter sp.]
MKGYYTVKLVGDHFRSSERMALEAKYAAALEARLGGPERALVLILEAATDGGRMTAVRAACALAEAAVWADNPLPEARFEIEAFTALDL